jgi:hypothetical protein
MAEHRLGRVDEARRLLAKAARWIEQVEQGKLQDDSFKLLLSWHARLELQLLCREAQGMIEGGKP